WRPACPAGRRPEAGAIDREAVDVRCPSRSKQLLLFDRTADLRDQQTVSDSYSDGCRERNRISQQGCSRWRLFTIPRYGEGGSPASAGDLWRWRDGVRRGYENWSALDSQKWRRFSRQKRYGDRHGSRTRLGVRRTFSATRPAA